MSIISRKMDRKEPGTVFRHAIRGNILCRLDVRLEKDDWEQLPEKNRLVKSAFLLSVSVGSSDRCEKLSI